MRHERSSRHANRFERLLAAVVVAAAAVGLLAQPAHAGPPAPTVPTDIAVPAGNKVFLVGHAVGVQIYLCNGSTWGFVAPRANLYDDQGNLIITHYGGPSWQALDGGIVRAKKDSGVNVDPSAIDWLLLSKTSTVVGPDGDRLAPTTFIQRINTTGGTAPAASTCTASTAGTMQEVGYTADYYFWKGRTA